MQKVFNALSAVSFVLVVAIGAGGVITYKWATSPKTHEQLQQKVVESVKGSLKIPGATGGAMPLGGSKKGAKLPF